VNGTPWDEQRADLDQQVLRLQGPLSWFEVLGSVSPGATFVIEGSGTARALEGGRVLVFPCPVNWVELKGDPDAGAQPVVVRVGRGCAPLPSKETRPTARHQYLGNRSVVCPAQVSATEPSVTGAPYPGWTSPIGDAPTALGQIVDIPHRFLVTAAAAQANRAFEVWIADDMGLSPSEDPVPLVRSASSAQRGGRHVASACTDCLPGKVQVYVANPGAVTVTVEVAAWLLW
jgi:hypothetical protein